MKIKVFIRKGITTIALLLTMLTTGSSASAQVVGPIDYLLLAEMMEFVSEELLIPEHLHEEAMEVGIHPDIIPIFVTGTPDQIEFIYERLPLPLIGCTPQQLDELSEECAGLIYEYLPLPVIGFTPEQVYELW